jgi:peptidyl-prolyl cis-trans isomerase SurA
MKTLVALSLSLITAASVAAQQPASQPDPPAHGVPLDAVAAVVGDQVITRYDMQERINQMIQQGQVPAPKDDAAQQTLEGQVVAAMVEEELILQKAKELKIEVADGDIAPDIDRSVKEVRARFPSEAEYRTAIAKAGLGTPEEYRRMLTDQIRRNRMLERTMAKLREDKKVVPINVSDAEVAAEFDRARTSLPPRPASVTFHQIVIAPQPSAEEKELARVKAESLSAELKRGADFAQIAKRESMDPLTKETGGDLGWMRRTDNIPEFERWLFGSNTNYPLQPGQTSPVFETPLGFHIVRVDRVQPGEVKARQIKISPRIDTADVTRAKLLADSVAKVWKAGGSFDSLAKKFHDYASKEETSLMTPFERDKLPPSYQNAFKGLNATDIVAFKIPGSSSNPDVPKFVVARLETVDEGGERTLAEMRELVRADMAQQGGVRRYLDTLRQQMYVSVRIDSAPPASASAKP